MNTPIQPRLPRFARFWCDASPFRINTSKSVSKQTTSTLFRMNTYGKHTGWGRGTILPFFESVTGHSPLDSSSFFSHSSALFCAFLHSCKVQPFSFQALPHSLPRKNTRRRGRVQKRRRPSRSDGGICGKGVPSSGEKIVDRFTVAKNVVAVQSSGGGGGGGTFVRNFPRCPCSMV